MSSLGISARLYALVALGMAGFVALFFSGSAGFARIGEAVAAVLDDCYPSVVLEQDIGRHAASMRVMVLAHALEPSPDVKRDWGRQIEAEVAEVHQRIEEFRATRVFDDSDRQNIASIADSFEAYRLVAMQIVSLPPDGELVYLQAHLAELRRTAMAMNESVNAALRHDEEGLQRAMEDTAQAVASAHTRAYVLGGVLVVVMVTVGVWLAHSIRGPLIKLTHALEHASSRLDFTASLPVRQKGDELDQAAGAFNSLIRSMRESLQNVYLQAERVADLSGNLQLAAESGRHSSQKQSESSAGIAAAVEQLTVGISHIDEQAVSVTSETRQARGSAETGHAVIEQTVHDISDIQHTVAQTSSSLDHLNRSSSEIASSVASIREISDQTNLLALNAAIEAARAGEQGRGFAVVADEVRKLAERTGLLTREIAGLIEQINAASSASAKAMAQTVEQVRAGAERAAQATQAMGDISASSERVMAMIGDVTSAIKEQNAASALIAQSIEHISQMSESGAQSALKSLDLASQLREASQSMLKTVDAYTL